MGDTKVLCLDEVFVTDVADAAIMSRLFGYMWDQGLVLVSTSNRYCPVPWTMFTSAPVLPCSLDDVHFGAWMGMLVLAMPSACRRMDDSEPSVASQMCVCVYKVQV